MRIVSGKFRGRALAAPDHDGLRPTSDRVRESVFNILAHGIADFEPQGTRVIDLFAGTGALGLEAMSRGAAYCLFVEDNADARALIRDNVEAFGLTGETRIFKRDATDLGPAAKTDRYGLAFLDPPYGKGLAELALASAREGDWLVPDALVVVEEAADAEFKAPAGFAEIERRQYDDTEFVFLRRPGSVNPC